MIHVRVESLEALEALRTVYANKLNATSRGARFAMNNRKQQFKDIFTKAATVTGEPVEGQVVIAIYRLCLSRCDWDAPIKALQDACEEYIACKNDRVIRTAMAFLVRPTKKRTGQVVRNGSIDVNLYDMDTELEDALDMAREAAECSIACWQSSY